jgi:DNA-binding NarL/FixJ family response regulator
MTTIVLADNQSIALRGLRVLLENASDIQIIGEASDGLEAVALVERLQPDMLLLDLEMPGLVGFEVAKRLRQRLPSLLILI